MRHLPIILLLLLCLAGCKTREIVKTEVVEVPRISVVERHDTVRDSIVRNDSVIIFQRGDTVFKEKWNTQVRWKDRIKTVEKTDTFAKVVQVPYKIHVEVPAKLSRWQKLEIYCGRALMGLLAITGISWLSWLYFGKRRKK